ncbi:YjbQ family protein [Candidatus Microgenomates bacterium]|nr:YjbQ family protein [Candidatus Microgenomates bacterium]
MKIIDKTIELDLKEKFTPFKKYLIDLIKKEKLQEANIVCWVPHEVASLVQVGNEEGITEDLNDFLGDTAPAGKWMHHDEPGTPFRHNFFEHIQTKIVGSVNWTFLVKGGELIFGKYQDLFFFSPVFKDIPKERVFCRILKFK